MTPEMQELSFEAIEKEILTEGYHLKKVPAECGCVPPYAYTVGLYQTVRVPELMTFGLPMHISKHVLHSIAAKAVVEEIFLEDGIEVDGILQSFPVKIRKVSKAFVERYTPLIAEYYDNEVPAFQVLWTDTKGKFPGQKGFETHLLDYQPTWP
jgi:hypothetical protein